MPRTPNMSNPPKRACNNCRQQKLRCDAVIDPFTACSRCRRLRLECQVSETFTRKRRTEELQLEIDRLKSELSKKDAQAGPTDNQTVSDGLSPNSDLILEPNIRYQEQQQPISHHVDNIQQIGHTHTPSPHSTHATIYAQPHTSPNEAGVSLMNLYGPGVTPPMPTGLAPSARLDDIDISAEVVQKLFHL
jgi:hypothetical protein